MKRIPKLHKTMSQETNSMLMQYQLDHPSDTLVNQIDPAKVPVAVYWKVRRAWEKHNRNRQIRERQGSRSASPRTGTVPGQDNHRAGDRNVSRQTVRGTLAKKKASAGHKKNAIDHGLCISERPRTSTEQFAENLVEELVEGVSSDAVSLAESADRLEDMKQFLRRTSKKGRNGISERMNSDSSQKCFETCHDNMNGALFSRATDGCGSGDSHEMATVYREFSKTLQRDREEKMRISAKQVHR